MQYSTPSPIKQLRHILPASSLSMRLAIFVTLIAIPIVAYFGFITVQRYRLTVDMAQERVNNFTQLVADHYTTHLNLTENMLASVGVGMSYNEDSGCAMLPELRSNMYYSLSIINADGNIICSVPTDADIAVPEAWLDRANTDDSPEVNFFVDESLLIAGYTTNDFLIVAPMSLDWIGDWLHTLDLPADITASIVNNDGVLLATYSNATAPQSQLNQPFFSATLYQDLLNNDDAISRADDANGATSYFGLHPLNDGLNMVIAVPEQDIINANADLILSSLVGLAILAVVYALVAWRLSLWLMLNPIKEMITRTERLRQGDTQTRITRPIRIAELNALADRINELATSLDIRDTEICDYTERLKQEISDHKQTIALLQTEMQARKKAEQSGNNRLKFMGIVAHELKTPLTTIKGFARTLLAEDVTWDEVNSREFISVIDEEADLLADMIEQLLDISQIDAGRLSTHMVITDLDNIFRTAQTRIETLTKHHQLELNTLDSSPMLKADPMRISQVLVNLIGNAAKYSPPETEITVDVHTVEGKYIRIDVSDQGQGIPQDQRELLFKPFHRIDEQTRGIKGAGLGLSICKGIIDVHQGDIWITDHGDSPGTTFSFTLPIVPRSDNVTAS